MEQAAGQMLSILNFCDFLQKPKSRVSIYTEKSTEMHMWGGGHDTDRPH